MSIRTNCNQDRSDQAWMAGVTAAAHFITASIFSPESPLLGACSKPHDAEGVCYLWAESALETESVAQKSAAVEIHHRQGGNCETSRQQMSADHLGHYSTHIRNELTVRVNQGNWSLSLRVLALAACATTGTCL